MLFLDEGIVVYSNSGVVKSDISGQLKEELKSAILPLEASVKNYRSNSDQKVIDLVDPSLFMFVSGYSREVLGQKILVDNCLSMMGKGEVKLWNSTPAPQPSQFQYLPCEVELQFPTGCLITSYINNIHPRRHTGLYKVLETIIDCTIPLWSYSLGGERLRATAPSCLMLPRVDYQALQFLVWDKEPKQRPGESDQDFGMRCWAWKPKRVETIPPEPEPFRVRGHPEVYLGTRWSKLHMIVQLSSI